MGSMTTQDSTGHQRLNRLHYSTTQHVAFYRLHQIFKAQGMKPHTNEYNSYEPIP